ncbi:rhomboid family intramembrane serine protease [Bacteroides sp. 224]|uniref:rhomboid family intramembrane serine protease n=1 Tax=Bacteroides sp. 224 TaxID=2302936 RepID=UPI001EF32CAB|nr:rhomboid family intramembrane serine protease [Bacteroides sp. 224]
MRQPIFDNLKNNFRKGNITIQLIYINVGVFLLMSLFSVGFLLFNRSAYSIFSWFELPASFTNLLNQPWSLFTYMFMHAGILHILFNMLWLYWFGNIFLQFFSSKHLRGLYLFGGLCGGLLYMIAFNVFPYFEPVVESSVMVGASASVLAIVAAAAYRAPDYRINLLLFGPVRLKYLAIGVIILDLVFLVPGDMTNPELVQRLASNAGGHIAHIGGALSGIWFAASLSKGADLTSWINKLFDGIIRLFSKDTWEKKPKKAKMKVNHSRNMDYDYNARKKESSDEIDRILDKLKKSGYNSLTTEEKKSLFDASKK